MGNWIPGDPTLVAQILKISSAYSPPPPEGFISPMAWGVESNVIERFGAAGIAPEKISCDRDTYTFNFPGSPAEFVAAFRKYYGPTMNAFAAAETNGREADLQRELETLFNERTRARARTRPLSLQLSCGLPFRARQNRERNRINRSENSARVPRVAGAVLVLITAWAR